MVQDIRHFFREHLHFFQKYDKVILYYDNGQQELSHILNMVLETELTAYEALKLLPSDNRLFQVADLLCTLELLRVKLEQGKQLSKSEILIFHSKHDLQKDFLKSIKKKEYI